ncbi:hypothetical protein [Vibrio coralliilyticus]|uniref:hypothetical protein n=1 Tax=Vibrio coralliilyticus TaxID=190893 RepID=UPI00117D2948|nr:hypothetical protein [Vibrio coralliilyticus]
MPAFCWFFCAASAHLNIVDSVADRTISIMVGWARQLRLAVSYVAVVPTLFGSPPEDWYLCVVI